MVATRNAVKASPVVSANKSRGAVHDDSGISLAHIDAPTLSKFTPVVATEVPKMKIVDKQLIPAGIPVSGRIWKAPGVKSFNRVKVRSLHTSYEKRKEEKLHLEGLKRRTGEMKAAMIQEKRDARERATQRKKQREENELKSSVVQVIRNTGKIKKMGKKQLRMIKKMDTTTMKTKVI